MARPGTKCIVCFPTPTIYFLHELCIRRASSRRVPSEGLIICDLCKYLNNGVYDKHKKRFGTTTSLSVLYRAGWQNKELALPSVPVHWSRRIRSKHQRDKHTSARKYRGIKMNGN